MLRGSTRRRVTNLLIGFRAPRTKGRLSSAVLAITIVGIASLNAFAQVPVPPRNLRILQSASPPVLTQLVLAPTTATVAVGAPQQFTASGVWSNGATGPATVTWGATGGTITSGGLYTAGLAAGTYEISARQVGGTLSALAYATVTSPSSSAPPGSITVSPGQSTQAAANVAPR